MRRTRGRGRTWLAQLSHKESPLSPPTLKYSSIQIRRRFIHKACRVSRNSSLASCIFQTFPAPTRRASKQCSTRVEAADARRRQEFVDFEAADQSARPRIPLLHSRSGYLGRRLRISPAASKSRFKCHYCRINKSLSRRRSIARGVHRSKAVSRASVEESWTGFARISAPFRGARIWVTRSEESARGGPPRTKGGEWRGLVVE